MAMMKGLQTQEQKRWEVYKRLEFLEFQLYWKGIFRRRFMTEHFGISSVQATNDIRKYQELAPRNIDYSLSKRCYYPTAPFHPLFYKPNSEDFLVNLSQDSFVSLNVSCNVLSLPKQPIDSNYLRQIVQAIENKRTITVRYLSLSGDSDKWRQISPIGFISDGELWHVRAFCHNDNFYKNFTLSRFFGVQATNIISEMLPVDRQWEEEVEAVLIPNQAMSPQQKTILESEYHLKDGKLRVTIRMALYFYLKQRLHVNEKNGDPLNCPWIIENKEALDKVEQQLR